MKWIMKALNQDYFTSATKLGASMKDSLSKILLCVIPQEKLVITVDPFDTTVFVMDFYLHWSSFIDAFVC